LRIGDISFDDDCRRLTTAIEEVLEKNAAERRDRGIKAEQKIRERSEAEFRERLEARRRVREERERLQHESQLQTASVKQSDGEQRESQTTPELDKKAWPGIRIFSELTGKVNAGS
jgi:hypothetical protein